MTSDKGASGNRSEEEVGGDAWRGGSAVARTKNLEQDCETRDSAELHTSASSFQGKFQLSASLFQK